MSLTTPKTRPLALLVKTNGRIMRQVWREGSVAIYRDAGGNSKLGSAGFEVIIIRTSKPHPRDRRAGQYDLVELYPSSEGWGEFGWTFTKAFPHRVGAIIVRIAMTLSKAHCVRSN